MRVAELMTRDVVSVEPEATLREVASVLSTAGISGAPVVAGEQVVGVISAADLVEFDADSPGSPTERVGQLTGFGETVEAMAADVQDGLEASAAYFAELWEDAGADVVERMAETDSPEWNVLDEHLASEVMSGSVFTLGPDTGVQEAARRMVEAEVHRALVVEDGRLAGVLTTRDVLRAVAERGLGG